MKLLTKLNLLLQLIKSLKNPYPLPDEIIDLFTQIYKEIQENSLSPSRKMEDDMGREIITIPCPDFIKSDESTLTYYVVPNSSVPSNNNIMFENMQQHKVKQTSDLYKHLLSQYNKLKNGNI